MVTRHGLILFIVLLNKWIHWDISFMQMIERRWAFFDYHSLQFSNDFESNLMSISLNWWPHQRERKDRQAKTVVQIQNKREQVKDSVEYTLWTRIWLIETQNTLGYSTYTSVGGCGVWMQLIFILTVFIIGDGKWFESDWADRKRIESKSLVVIEDERKFQCHSSFIFIDRAEQMSFLPFLSANVLAHISRPIIVTNVAFCFYTGDLCRRRIWAEETLSKQNFSSLFLI